MSMPEKPTVWDLTLSLSAEARTTCETRCRGFWSQQLLRAFASPCKVLRQAKILFRAATSCAAPARLPALTQRAPLGGRQGSPANAHAGQTRSVGRRSAAKANAGKLSLFAGRKKRPLTELPCLIYPRRNVFPQEWGTPGVDNPKP